MIMNMFLVLVRLELVLQLQSSQMVLKDLNIRSLIFPLIIKLLLTLESPQSITFMMTMELYLELSQLVHMKLIPFFQILNSWLMYLKLDLLTPSFPIEEEVV